MHNVMIEDDNDNWSRWGLLVKNWITNSTTRPTTVAALRTSMQTAGVVGIVEGAGDRGVSFVDYADDGPIIIPLPTKKMVEFDDQLLDEISLRPVGQRRYPLPVFYSVAFGGVSMVDLGNAELRSLATRRLGEYVINECM